MDYIMDCVTLKDLIHVQSVSLISHCMFLYESSCFGTSSHELNNRIVTLQDIIYLIIVKSFKSHAQTT